MKLYFIASTKIVFSIFIVIASAQSFSAKADESLAGALNFMQSKFCPALNVAKPQIESALSQSDLRTLNSACQKDITLKDENKKFFLNSAYVILSLAQDKTVLQSYQAEQTATFKTIMSLKLLLGQDEGGFWMDRESRAMLTSKS